MPRPFKHTHSAFCCSSSHSSHTLQMSALGNKSVCWQVISVTKSCLWCVEDAFCFRWFLIHYFQVQFPKSEDNKQLSFFVFRECCPCYGASFHHWSAQVEMLQRDDAESFEFKGWGKPRNFLSLETFWRQEANHDQHLQSSPRHSNLMQGVCSGYLYFLRNSKLCPTAGLRSSDHASIHIEKHTSAPARDFLTAWITSSKTRLNTNFYNQ